MEEQFGRFERFSLDISEISHCWHKLAGEEMEPYGLKGSHCLYLLALARNPEGLTAPKMVEICGRDKSDVSRMLSLLEKAKLVDKEGRYGATYRLTVMGHTAAEHVKKRAALAVELAGRDLTQEDRENFYRALDSIAFHLKELSEDGLPCSE